MICDHKNQQFICRYLNERKSFSQNDFMMETRRVLLLLCIFNYIAFCYSKSFESEKCCDEYCYDADKEHLQNGHFNSLSAYDYVKGSDLERESKVASELKRICVKKNRSKSEKCKF